VGDDANRIEKGEREENLHTVYHITKDYLHERFIAIRQSIEVKVDIGTVAFHRYQLQVTTKVAGILYQQEKGEQ
jgi:hypothetical protein